MLQTLTLTRLTKGLLVSGAVACTGLSLAQDVGRVLSSTPALQQVAVPRRVCSTEQVAVQTPKSGAGAAIGAIAGGAIGSAVGQGAGRAAATVLGVIGGAVVGDRVEGAPPTQVQDVSRCHMQTFYENRPVGYNVVYEFAGKQYSVQMPNDPGPTIALQVTPVGASPPMAAPEAQATYAQPAYAQPAYAQPTYVQPEYNPPPVVVVSPPAYPGYYAQPYFPAIRLDLGYGVWGGGYAGRRHWRR